MSFELGRFKGQERFWDRTVRGDARGLAGRSGLAGAGLPPTNYGAVSHRTLPPVDHGLSPEMAAATGQ